MTLSFPVFFFCSLVIIGGRAGRLRPYSPAIFGVLRIVDTLMKASILFLTLPLLHSSIEFIFMSAH